MAEAETTQAVRFGRTVVQPAAGELVDQSVQAIVYAANSRGVMGAGPAGSVRLVGGLEIEREAMESAPFDLGTAFVTGSGRLADRGIEAVIHAVVAPHLGEVAEVPEVRRALAAALRIADARRYHSFALPILGLRADATAGERTDVVEAIVDEFVAHLRRGGSRLESVVVVSRFDDDLAMIMDSLGRARQRSWTNLP
jgi:O-acetyl-ADP-ribose deacetylase (regulator of RNase III)